jgi:hypothetical protein
LNSYLLFVHTDIGEKDYLRLNLIEHYVSKKLLNWHDPEKIAQTGTINWPKLKFYKSTKKRFYKNTKNTNSDDDDTEVIKTKWKRFNYWKKLRQS